MLFYLFINLLRVKIGLKNPTKRKSKISYAWRPWRTMFWWLLIFRGQLRCIQNLGVVPCHENFQIPSDPSILLLGPFVVSIRPSLAFFRLMPQVLAFSWPRLFWLLANKLDSGNVARSYLGWTVPLYSPPGTSSMQDIQQWNGGGHISLHEDTTP